MVSVCNQCGLPQDLCVCEAIAREQQKIKVKLEKRKFGKKYTIVSGFKSEVNLTDIVKKLKGRFACGGTAKGGQVELQGNHISRIKPVLIELGFPDETIEIEG